MEMDAEDADTIYAWPTCSKCSKPRQTICPYCGAAGHDFGPAYGVDAAAEAESADRPDRIPVLCHTCDEAFWTRFHPRCAWCGHAEGGPAALHDGGAAPSGALAKVGELLSIGGPDRSAAGVGLPIHKPTRGRGGCGSGCGCSVPVQEAHRAAAERAQQLQTASPFAMLPGASSSGKASEGDRDDDAPPQPPMDEADAEVEEASSLDEEGNGEPSHDPRTLEEREAHDRLVAQRSAMLIGIMTLGGAVLTAYLFWIGSR